VCAAILAIRDASKAGEQLCLPKQRAIAEPRPQTQTLHTLLPCLLYSQLSLVAEFLLGQRLGEAFCPSASVAPLQRITLDVVVNTALTVDQSRTLCRTRKLHRSDEARRGNVLKLSIEGRPVVLCEL